MALSLSIGIVTWNSADVIEPCLAAVRALDWPQVELRVLDNGSTDLTRELLRRSTAPHERLLLDENTGFARGHNRLIDGTTGEFYLALNPDVVLAPGFARALITTMERDPRVGAATGKLTRFTPPGIIDTTGIVMRPSQRHLDRGADEPDRGQFNRVEYVFGASGAAALYRRTMLADVRVLGEYFDEDFFAYREDADLAWRAQLLGWRCVYVPAAEGRHRRHVTPERRNRLSPEINRASVRNRFLLRLKNQTLAHACAFAFPALLRDLQVIGYVFLREWSSVPGIVDVLRLAPRTLQKRRLVMQRRRASDAEVIRWFRRAAQPWPFETEEPGQLQ